jgi:uncharacterized protein with ParB-like and HNH nuclease domain
MEAGPVRLIQYLDGMKQNVIPLFQRPYTWEKDKWQNLWDDILEIYDGNEDKSHFMGAIVTIPIRTTPVGVNKHLIIDGQQRLITVSILLCAIRKIIDQKKKALIDDYLVNRHYEGADNLKIMPTNSDRDDYLRLVKTPDEINSSSLIIKSYDFFEKQLIKKRDNATIDPNKFLEIVVNSLDAVMINLTETDDPYLIFESLNHKGQPLTQGDLVRNFALMKFKHSIQPNGEQEKIYNSYWLPMEQLLGKSLEDYLYHCIRKNGDDVRKNAIYSAYRDYLNLKSKPEDVALSLKNMKQLSEYYNRFIHPETEENKEVSRYLSTYNRLNKTVSFPLLLRLYESVETKNLSQENLKNCLYILESFIIRREICKISTNYLRNIFIDLCKNYKSVDTENWLTNHLSQYTGNLRWPNNEEVQRCLLDDEFYAPRIAQFVLERLEENFEHKEKIEFSNISIEHILPQTITPEWRALLGEKYSGTEEIPARLVHNIGNLTLTGYNPALSNSPFSKKKEILARSHFELNKWIVEQNSWSEKEVKERATMLGLKVIKIWQGPTGKN